MQVDAVPEGFEVIYSKHGLEFYCASCEIPVEPDSAAKRPPRRQISCHERRSVLLQNLTCEIDMLGYSAASAAFRLFARRMRSKGYSMIIEPHDEHAKARTSPKIRLSGLGASTMRASHCRQFGRSGSILCPQATEFRFCNAGALGRVPRSISACTPLGSFFLDARTSVDCNRGYCV
jgi:hypothetical protein